MNSVKKNFLLYNVRILTYDTIPVSIDCPGFSCVGYSFFEGFVGLLCVTSAVLSLCKPITHLLICFPVISGLLTFSACNSIFLFLLFFGRMIPALLFTYLEQPAACQWHRSILLLRQPQNYDIIYIFSIFGVYFFSYSNSIEEPAFVTYHSVNVLRKIR
jgi:hypothetical protein